MTRNQERTWRWFGYNRSDIGCRDVCDIDATKDHDNSLCVTVNVDKSNDPAGEFKIYSRQIINKRIYFGDDVQGNSVMMGTVNKIFDFPL